MTFNPWRSGAAAAPLGSERVELVDEIASVLDGRAVARHDGVVQPNSRQVPARESARPPSFSLSCRLFARVLVVVLVVAADE